MKVRYRHALYVIILFWLSGFAIYYTMHSQQNLAFTDFVNNLTTYTLGLVTVFFAIIGVINYQKDAKARLNLSRIDRRKDRLREQLNFYSYLMGEIKVTEITIKRSDWVKDVIKRHNIEELYDLMAQTEFKHILDEYYENWIGKPCQPGTQNAIDWESFSDRFIQAIKDDFTELHDDYEILTGQHLLPI